MGKQDLYISIPSFFRCPISLDIMKSPVSLSTGVTYDRTSIQRWLENGNNTCPATMQVLDSKDFVPNHTLQRLIQIWYNNHNHLSQSSKSKPPQFHSLSANQIADLIKQLLGGQIIKKRVLFESFVKILCFATESAENRRFLASNQPFLDHLVFTVSAEVGPGSDPDLLEAVLKTLHLVIASRDVNLGHVRQKMGNSCDFLQTLVRILKTGRLGSRVAAIGIIEELRRHSESKKAVFDHQELVPELLELVKCGKLEKDGEIQAVLSCLISLSSTRRNKLKLVRAEGVKLVGDILSSYQTPNNNNNYDNSSNNSNSKNVIIMIELLLTLLEMLAGCTEGRSAISEDPNCVPMIINKLMKVSKAANEHGIALLWSMCYLFRDQKARDSVVNSNSGLTKILLLMQSDCSPAVKQMCCDLLRIFKVNSKSCLSSYETKTTHIMPC